MKCKNIVIEKDKEIAIKIKRHLKKAIELNEISIDIDIDVYANYIHHQIKLIATLSNNKVSKDILNGMVHLIMRSLKKS